MKKPTVITECSHNYCATCIDEIRAYNFQELKCLVCGCVGSKTFRNLALEKVIDQFEDRRFISVALTEWVNDFNADSFDD